MPSARRDPCGKERRAGLGALLTLLLACSNGGAPDPPAAARPDVPDTTVGAAGAPAMSSGPRPDDVAPPDSADAAGSRGAGASDGWTVGRVAVPGRSAGTAVLRDVRTGRQADHDRVVFEFGGGALPGYRAEYVDSPQHQCGSGAEVRLGGDAWIEITFEPAQAHDEQGRATVAQRSARPTLPNLLELRATCDFEGQVTWVLGLRSPEPFRVLTLREPARIVLDVQH